MANIKKTTKVGGIVKAVKKPAAKKAKPSKPVKRMEDAIPSKKMQQSAARTNIFYGKDKAAKDAKAKATATKVKKKLAKSGVKDTTPKKRLKTALGQEIQSSAYAAKKSGKIKF